MEEFLYFSENKEENNADVSKARIFGDQLDFMDKKRYNLSV